MIHHARDAMSSRHSLRSSHEKAPLSERKEDLLEIAGGEACPREAASAASSSSRALAAHPATREQDESIAHPRSVGDLVNRQHERASITRVRAQRGCRLPALAQVQAVERLVGEQYRLWRQHADREPHALALALRERAHRRVEQRGQVEPLDDLLTARLGPPKNPIT